MKSNYSSFRGGTKINNKTKEKFFSFVTITVFCLASICFIGKRKFFKTTLKKNKSVCNEPAGTCFWCRRFYRMSLNSSHFRTGEHYRSSLLRQYSPC